MVHDYVPFRERFEEFIQERTPMGASPSLPLGFPALYNPLMAREYGPFRERFEKYILERTGDHPSVVRMVMMQSRPGV